MPYCNNCGAKIENMDKFCEVCGTKIRTKQSKDMIKVNQTYMHSSNKYVLPAIFSFLIPTLGQFVKGQFKWAIILWVWFILGNSFIFALSGLLGPFSIILSIAFSLFMYVYQLYDAYNAPEEDD